MKYKDKIPPELYGDEIDHPYAETVADLIAILKRVPGSLPVRDLKDDDIDGVSVLVGDIDSGDAFLSIVRAGE